MFEKTLRKAIACVSTTALLLSFTLVPGMGVNVAQANISSAANSGDWYAPTFEAMQDLGILNMGLNFDPSDPMARDVFSCAVVDGSLASGLIFPEDLSSSHPFTDVDSAYDECVGTLYNLDVIKGVAPTLFGSKQSLTKEQATKIIAILLGLVEQDEEGTVTPTGFSDVPSDHWAAVYIKALADENIVQGEGGTTTFGLGSILNYAVGSTLGLRGVEVIDANTGSILPGVEVVERGGETGGETPDENPLVGPESLSVNAADLGSRNIPRGANNVVFGSYEVDGNADVTKVTVKREGPGDEIDINNVYLYFGDTLLAESDGQQLAYAGEGIQMAQLSKQFRVERISTGKSINSDSQEVTFFVNIKLRGKGVLEVRGDLTLTAAASAQHGFRLTSLTTTNDVYDFPTSDNRYFGGLTTVSGATTGTVTVRNNASLNDLYVGDRGVISRGELQMNSTEGGLWIGATFQVQGGVSASDLVDFELYIVGRTEPIAKASAVGFNDLVTFVTCVEVVNGECTPYEISKGDTVVFYIEATLVGAQDRETVQVNFDETTDLHIIGTTLGFGLQVNTTAFNTTANVLGADITIKFLRPDAGETAAGLNSAVLAVWEFSNKTDSRLQLRDWTVDLFNTVNANLLAANNRVTNMRLTSVDENNQELATLFSSLDINNTSSVTAAAAAVRSGVAGFESVITFSGSYDVAAGETIQIAFMANLESTLVASQFLVTLDALADATGVLGFIRDQNNDNLTIASVKPAAEISATFQTILTNAIQITLSPKLGNPAIALGEVGVDLMAHNMRAGAGVDLNISRFDVGIVAGPAGAPGGSLAANARATFLDLRLEVEKDGERVVVSTIETIDQNGTIQFDNLEGLLTIPKGASYDVFLVGNVNTSGTVSGATPYQFAILANSMSATNESGRQIDTVNLIGNANINGQLPSVATGGNILLNDQSQTRTQYVSQTVTVTVTIDAIVFKLESENASSQLDDFNIAVDTGVASRDQLVVTAVPAATNTLIITEGNTGGNVNGVAAFGTPLACVVTFNAGGGDELNCNDNAAAVDITAANTVQLVAASLRGLLTVNRYTVTGSGAGVVFTRNAPATDANIAFTGTGIANFTATVLVTGSRSGQARADITVAVPGAATTLIIGDNTTANLCTVTFNDATAAALDDELDCSDNAATVDLDADTATADGPARTATQLAAILGDLFGIAGYATDDSGTNLTVTGTFPLQAAQNTLAIAGTAGFAVVQLAPGTTTAGSTATSMLSSATIMADGVEILNATTIGNNTIQFRDANFDLQHDVPYVMTVRVKPKQVITGGATAGQTFRLALQKGIFRTANSGSILSKSGNELNPNTGALNNANPFVIQQASIFFESGGSIDSDLLSSGTLQFLKFKMSKKGTGTAEVGDGLLNSQFQVKITKSAAVVITACEIRDASNTVLATANAPFNSDSVGTAFANQAAQDAATEAIVNFAEANFVSGKRITAGSAVYTVYCTVTTVPNNTSMQVSISSDLNIGVVDNDTSVMNVMALILGVPQNGTSRVSPN